MPSVSLFVLLSVCLSICWPHNLSLPHFLYLSVCKSVCVCLSACVPSCMAACLCVCLSVCPPDSPNNVQTVSSHRMLLCLFILPPWMCVSHRTPHAPPGTGTALILTDSQVLLSIIGPLSFILMWPSLWFCLDRACGAPQVSLLKPIDSTPDVPQTTEYLDTCLPLS